VHGGSFILLPEVTIGSSKKGGAGLIRGIVAHFVIVTCRGATTAEKLRGTKIWVPTPGRLRSALVVGK